MRVKFTSGRIANFTCPPGKSAAFLWDTEVPGLGLKASPGGSRKYVLESRLHAGSTIRVTIGDPKAWTIDAAQAEARRLQTLIDQGVDPRQQKQDLRLKALAEQQEARRQTLILGDLWPVYLEARKSKWSERSYKDHLRLSAPGGENKKNGSKTVAGPLAELMPISLKDLSSHRIARWLNAEAARRPTTAALSFRYLRACIRWAADISEYQGLVPSDAWSARVVRDAVPRTQAKEGDCLQREQLPSWFAAVRSLHNPVISSYLQALLLTGARREEMAGLRWNDVDFQWRSLTIRDKVEGSRTIPLPPYLASLLSELKRRNETKPSLKNLEKMKEEGKEWKPSSWVFSSAASADGKIAEPRIAHNEALTAAGLPHVTLHGLRRSFGTLCEWIEVPSGVSAQIMGHKPSALAEKHYRRRPLDLLRMWHDKMEAWMLLQAGIDFPSTQAGASGVNT
jgi:integrase